jgi:hypothetical protein
VEKIVAKIKVRKKRGLKPARAAGPSQSVDTLPSKKFFISMLTKDISLEDCILDLIDNAVDSAGVHARSRGLRGVEATLKAYSVALSLAKSDFAIEDNCGGMTIKTAREQAFHFGLLRPEALSATRPIGLFGIGMKRAVFKIGNDIIVRSSTGREAFQIKIDARQWANTPEWEFKLEPLQAPTVPRGTTITVGGLHEAVSSDFADAGFRKSLHSVIARDYSLILRRGLVVTLNGERVKPHLFKILEGQGFSPHLEKLQTKGVSIQILAGMAPPIAGVDDSRDEESLDVKNAGWFVMCNDRVVLAGDKTQRTGWGTPGMAGWHAQFGRFLGIARFTATDPQDLPWTTTKRDIDSGNAAYQVALPIMKRAARAFTAYTGKRRKDLQRAVRLERKAEAVEISEVTEAKTGAYPIFSQTKNKTETRVAYDVDASKFASLAKAFKLPLRPAGDVGLRSFEFAFTNLVDE